MVSPPRSRVAMLVRTPVPRATCHTHTRAEVRMRMLSRFSTSLSPMAQSSTLLSTGLEGHFSHHVHMGSLGRTAHGTR